MTTTLLRILFFSSSVTVSTEERNSILSLIGLPYNTPTVFKIVAVGEVIFQFSVIKLFYMFSFTSMKLYCYVQYISQTFDETSATRFLLLGSSNGTDSGWTPSITTFPNMVPFSLIFFVTALVSIPECKVLGTLVILFLLITCTLL